jgi:hypothetical protein
MALSTLATLPQTTAARTGLHLRIARTLAEVEEAWELVHLCRIRAGAAAPVSGGIFTVPQAVSPRSLVILARLGEVTVGTMTAVADGPGGLPLDEAWGEEAVALRAEGRRLLELCLFADRRASISRSFYAVLEMTRLVFYYARHAEATDLLIAPPLDHVPFYSKYFAFERVGRRREAPVLHGQKTSLMRLRLLERLAQTPLPPEIDYFMEKPVPTAEFEGRYQFPPEELAGSSIRDYVG